MIARVFPRQTAATPIDEYAFIGDPPLFVPDDVTEIHVSVTFSWDLPEAKRLASAWKRIAPVKIGGPATGMRGEEFVPGRYVKNGYVITSRGCPNHCWFCSVPQREGNIRELPITEGWNLLDDNILACSKEHIRGVFEMLRHQKMRQSQITGGLEAKRLQDWHIELLKYLRPKEIFFAYDTPDDKEPLRHARNLFREHGYGSHNILRCYALIGYPGDTISAAETRLTFVRDNLDMCPMAMLYRDEAGEITEEWRKFQRYWARPAAIYAKNRREYSTTYEEREWQG